ncbi:MAG: hypothetical protein Q9174_002014 [Haloplaca sp. 1 TL-2023]
MDGKLRHAFFLPPAPQQLHPPSPSQRTPPSPSPQCLDSHTIPTHKLFGLGTSIASLTATLAEESTSHPVLTGAPSPTFANLNHLPQTHHPSNSNATRRVSSGLAKVSTPPTSTRNAKGKVNSKIISLKVPSQQLARFAPKTQDEPSPPIPPSSQPSEIPAGSPAPKEEVKPVDVKPETTSPPAATPSSENSQPIAKEATGKPAGKASSPKTGSKRGLGAGVDGPKARARPGPKKKMKLEDSNGENAASSAKGGPGATTVPAHKLGPKANQGAINANLRALDRTKRPCRKWEKRGIRIKTFTGVTLELPSWRGGTKGISTGSGSDKTSLPASNSVSKGNNSSSQIGSENSAATPDPGAKAEFPAGTRIILVP